MSAQNPGEQPEPTTDAAPPVGPGGADAVPDWEDASEESVVPDPPRSAQVEDEKVPDEIDEPDNEVPDSAGDGVHAPQGDEEPAD